MKKNYTAHLPAGSKTQGQARAGFSQRVSMKTKILLAKIGLAICIIILIVAKSLSH